MFSFGIFASHTPFLIMAGLYLFYMLINLGMKANQDSGDAIQDENKTITHQAKASVVDQNTLLEFYPSDFQADDSDQAFEHQGIHLLPNLNVCYITWSYSHKYVRTFIDYHLFSRPPPAKA